MPHEGATEDDEIYFPEEDQAQPAPCKEDLLSRMVEMGRRYQDELRNRADVTAQAQGDGDSRPLNDDDPAA